MIGQPRFHRGRNAKRFVDAAEVVVGEVQRDGCFQVCEFLTESVGQARESADRHSHGEVLALYKASRDVVRIGSSVNDLGYDLRDSWWGVPRFGAIVLSVIPEQFHKLSKIRLSRKDALNGAVEVPAVSCNLKPFVAQAIL